jgi:hypothetical protein
VLSHHCLEGITNLLRPYFPSGELEKDVIQARTAQADTQYLGAKFLDKGREEFLSAVYGKS